MTITAPEIAICQKGEMPITGRGVINDPEEQRAAQAAQHPSASAHGADTADHAGGDHLSSKPLATSSIGDGEARDPQIAAEAGQRAGETEADELAFFRR